MSLNPSGSSPGRSTPISNGSLTCLYYFPDKKEPEVQTTNTGKTFYHKPPAEKPRDEKRCIAINIEPTEGGTYLTHLLCSPGCGRLFMTRLSKQLKFLSFRSQKCS